MYIETLIPIVARHMIATQHKDASFVSSINDYLENDYLLSSRQAAAIKSIFSKLPEPFVRKAGLKTETFYTTVASNRWRQAPRVVVQRRHEVRHLGDNLLGFIFNTTEIKDMAWKKISGVWRRADGHKIYVVSVGLTNYDTIIGFISNHGFETDAATDAYLELCLGSINQPTRFVAVGEGMAVNVTCNDALAQYLLDNCSAQVL